MKVTRIFFDLDGTVANTNDLIIKSFEHTFETYNIDYTYEDVLDGMGPTLLTTFKKYAKTEKEATEMVECYREFNHRMHDELIKPFPGVTDAIKKLFNDNYELAIVTSKPKWLAIRGLEVLGLKDYFSFVVGSDEVKKHKPDPEAMLLAMQMTKTKGDSLAIGDNVSDIEAAKRAFVYSVGVSWSLKYDDLVASRPDFMLDEMNDIFKILGRDK